MVFGLIVSTEKVVRSFVEQRLPAYSFADERPQRVQRKRMGRSATGQLESLFVHF